MPQGTQQRAREATMSDLEEKATHQFERIADKTTDQFSRAADRVEGAASSVAERRRDAGERIQEVTGNIKGAVDKSIKQQPMATLVIAAMLGFVLGALWKS